MEENKINNVGNQASASSPVKRQTAFLCTVKQLLSGEYVKKEGWEPSYLETSAGALSRVRISGLIVAVGQQITLDDGTGSINIRSFDHTLPSLKIGDPVLVIGRPRMYNDALYLLVESCKVLSSPSWLKYYKDSLVEWQSFVPPNPKKEVLVETEEKIVESEPVKIASSSNTSASVSNSSSDTLNGVTATSFSPAMELIGLIRDLDPGDGAPVDEVLSRASFDNPDAQLQFLISEGEVFELRAGKIKVLE